MYEYEKESFAEGKDILYRQWLSIPKKWTGWKSFRKACKNGNPPWPWDYPVSTEWKVYAMWDSGF
jgi:hypothetical protein